MEFTKDGVEYILELITLPSKAHEFKLSKAELPVLLRAYAAPTQPPRGPVQFIGNYNDHAGWVMRFGPRSYGFSPQSCADAPTFERPTPNSIR